MTFLGNGFCDVCSQVALPYSVCPVGFTSSLEFAADIFPECARCPAGYYCPVSGSMVPPLPCPEGHFCPESTWLPIECEFGMLCLPSRRSFVIGPILIILTLFLMFAIPRFVAWYLRRDRIERGVASTASINVSVPTSSALLSEKLPLLKGGKSETVSHRANIRLCNVSYRLGLCSQGKTLLADLSGAFKAGRITAVMGPSGAGKTTLLRVLRGVAKPSAGHIEVNGNRVRSLARFHKEVGFVPQHEDSVDPLLSVRQLLRLHCALRLPANEAYPSRITRLVNRAIVQLQLETVADQPIGGGAQVKVLGGAQRGLSGGQRKRASTAMEFVFKPRLLILDEPVSGLDSAAAYRCVSCLKKIGDDGVNVICTLHQPTRRTFDLFDDLLLLAHGQVCYWGPAADAFQWLSTVLGEPVNDADAMLDAVQNHEDALVRAWSERAERDDDGVPEMSGTDVLSEPTPNGASINEYDADEPSAQLRIRRTPLIPFQFVVQLRREFQTLVRRLSVVTTMVLSFAIAGILLGMAFFQPKYILPVPGQVTARCPDAVDELTHSSKENRPCANDWPAREMQGRAVQYLCMLLGALASSIGVTTFDSSRVLPIMRREFGAGLSFFGMFLSKDLLDSLLLIVYSFTFTSFYFAVASPYGAFGEYFVLTYAYMHCSVGIGYMFAAVFSTQTAVVIAGIFGMLSGIFSGLAFQRSPLWSFYFSEGLFRSEIRDVIKNAGGNLHYVETYAGEVYGYEVGPDTIRDDVHLILLYSLGFRVLSRILFYFIALRRKAD